MIAFLLPNEKSACPLQKYVVSVDSVEKLTGIDFFPALPNSIERRLERRIDVLEWSFSK
jgi:endonuclease G, mitochondrial